MRSDFTMLKKLAKIFVGLVGIVTGLSLIAYCVLLVANLNDRPPAAEIAVLESLLEDASPIVSDGNAYLFMMGFAGPPDSDPMTLGTERLEWMKRAGPKFDRSDDPLKENYDLLASRSDAASELAEVCPGSEAECARLLDSNEETVELWLSDEQWLLERYRSLIGMTEFSEAAPFGTLAPGLSYSAVLEGQRLHVVDAWKSASEADVAAISAALDRDLTYWRMVLRHSNVLITKMIATAAIDRHFKLGNVALRRLPQAVAADGIPASWRSAISDEERSMKRSFAGEWAFFDRSMKNIGDQLELFDSTMLDRVAWGLMKPFWQPQDMSNRYAKRILDLGNTFDVPYGEIAAAAEIADQLPESTHRPFSRLFNFIGDIVMSGGYSGFSDYAVRVANLEGIRRAALLAATLRAEGTSKDDVVQRMLASEIVDPYTNEPFTWNDGSDTIVFQGLGPEPRSQHELIY